MLEADPKKSGLVCAVCSYFTTDSEQYLAEFFEVTKGLLGHDTKLFLAFQTDVLELFAQQRPERRMGEELWGLYFREALLAIRNRSPHVRAIGLRIMNELVYFRQEPIIAKIKLVFRMADEEWWEVRAQLIILISRLLLLNPNTPNTSISIIIKLFNKQISHNILRIGVICLAELLNSRPELCERYLEILLEIGREVRADILEINEIRMGPVVFGSDTFVYQLTGAPICWNSIGIGKAMYEYCHQHNLQSFSKKHLDILYACLHQELQPADMQSWLDIYERLKEYLFSALLEAELCVVDAEILKKLFTFEQIQEHLMGSSRDSFLSLFERIYRGGVSPACPANLLEFLEYLNERKVLFKQYIYRLIKEFSEHSKELFLESNLVDFMNELAKERRNGQFE